MAPPAAVGSTALELRNSQPRYRFGGALLSGRISRFERPPGITSRLGEAQGETSLVFYRQADILLRCLYRLYQTSRKRNLEGDRTV